MIKKFFILYQYSYFNIDMGFDMNRSGLYLGAVETRPTTINASRTPSINRWFLAQWRESSTWRAAILVTREPTVTMLHFSTAGSMKKFFFQMIFKWYISTCTGNEHDRSQHLDQRGQPSRPYHPRGCDVPKGIEHYWWTTKYLCPKRMHS